MLGTNTTMSVDAFSKIRKQAKDKKMSPAEFRKNFYKVGRVATPDEKKWPYLGVVRQACLIYEMRGFFIDTDDNFNLELCKWLLINISQNDQRPINPLNWLMLGRGFNPAFPLCFSKYYGGVGTPDSFQQEQVVIFLKSLFDIAIKEGIEIDLNQGFLTELIYSSSSDKVKSDRVKLIVEYVKSSQENFKKRKGNGYKTMAERIGLLEETSFDENISRYIWGGMNIHECRVEVLMELASLLETEADIVRFREGLRCIDYLMETEQAVLKIAIKEEQFSAVKLLLSIESKPKLPSDLTDRQLQDLVKKAVANRDSEFLSAIIEGAHHIGPWYSIGKKHKAIEMAWDELLEVDGKDDVPLFASLWESDNKPGDQRKLVERIQKSYDIAKTRAKELQSEVDKERNNLINIRCSHTVKTCLERMQPKIKELQAVKKKVARLKNMQKTILGFLKNQRNQEQGGATDAVWVAEHMKKDPKPMKKDPKPMTGDYLKGSAVLPFAHMRGGKYKKGSEVLSLQSMANGAEFKHLALTSKYHPAVSA